MNTRNAAVRLTREYRQTLHGAPPRVFSLLCPEREKEKPKFAEAVAKEGIRPIMFRQERGALMAADGYSRMNNRHKFGVVITQGGPANSTETINVLLFNQAFSYFNMGYASSMAVVLFAIVMGASLLLIKVRRTTTW